MELKQVSTVNVAQYESCKPNSNIKSSIEIDSCTEVSKSDVSIVNNSVSGLTPSSAGNDDASVGFASLPICTDSSNASVCKDGFRYTTTPLRDYDRSLKTRSFLLTILGITLLCGICSVIISVILFLRTASGQTLDGADNVVEYFTANFSVKSNVKLAPGQLGNVLLATPATTEILTLVLVLTVTQLQEAVALVHAVGLRWILYAERRSTLNTNMRSFNHCKKSRANSWYMNLVYGLCMALAYTVASRVFMSCVLLVQDTSSTLGYQPNDVIIVNGIGLAVLGLAICGQTCIAFWSYLATRRYIYTWSSNAIINSLACIHEGLERHSGQCLVPLTRSPIAETGPLKPVKEQLSMTKSRPAVRLTLTWTSCAIAATFISVTFIAIYGESNYDSDNDSYGYGYGDTLKTGSYVTGTINIEEAIPIWTEELRVLFFVFAVQLYLTFTLHCAEVIVNTARDERSWRNATNKGIKLQSGSIRAAFSSWETILLFLFKGSIHWIFGSTTVTADSMSYTDNMPGIPNGGPLSTETTYVIVWALGIYILAGLLFLLVLMLVHLAYKSPKGPQPAAYGHYQTIVNLIDDWGEEGDVLFWGDKTEEENETTGIRHAGTSAKLESLKVVDMGAYYS